MQELLTKREAVLAELGASPAESHELLARSEVTASPELEELRFPLQDESFVLAWELYADQVQRTGSIAVLANYLVELNFPVSAGMSQDTEYAAATRKGTALTGMQNASGLRFAAPERGSVVLHSTPAGRIPLLITSCREDFVSLVQALACRNEPVEVPASMGACMVRGYNDWARIDMLRREFQIAGGSRTDWLMEFPKIKAQKHLYQDCFIILSDGPYSNVKAADLGLEEEHWRNSSFVIRREHECAHYFARRIFGSPCTSIMDEIIADYWGIVAAQGTFHARWLLRFFGLESFPDYREGGRLQNYRGKPPLSQGAFIVLQQLVKHAVENLERFHRRVSPSLAPDFQPALLGALCSITAEELAASDGPELLTSQYLLWAEATRAEAYQCSWTNVPGQPLAMPIFKNKECTKL
jgi:hypothetical protein